MTFSHWSGDMFLRVLSIVMPALLISTSMGPKSFVTVSTKPTASSNPEISAFVEFRAIALLG